MMYCAFFLALGWAGGKLNIPGRWLPKNPFIEAIDNKVIAFRKQLVADLENRMMPPAQPAPLPPATK